MLVTRILDKEVHNRDNFDCGVKELNNFIKKNASQSANRSLSKTFVLVDTENPQNIIAFYTLAYADVSASENMPLFKNYGHKLPAIKLTRMAVDKKSQGKKIGEQMLIEVILKTANTKNPDNPASVIGLFVDAKANAVNFYKKYNFIEVETNNNTLLYLPIQTCIEAKFS